MKASNNNEILRPKYKCPMCLKVVELENISHLYPVDEHVFICGRAKCKNCGFEDDYMTFVPVVFDIPEIDL